MSISTHTLIWLFPIAFIFHDFEELLFLPPWLKKNAPDIRDRIPVWLVRHLDSMSQRSNGAFATAVCFPFILAALSSFLAVEHQSYGFFLLAGAMFFVHGFGHLFQTLLLRRYVPGVFTSLLFVIPYGLFLFARLLGEGIVGWTGLLVYCVAGAVLFLPFIVAVLKLGEIVYARAAKLLL
jgi:hypothetical protein